MADYFDTIILPRIKKLAYSLDWKNGKPVIDKNNKKSQELEIDLDEQENINTNNGGIFVKYQTLEQYEDSLENIANELKPDELLLYTEIDDYLIKYMIDWESNDSNIFLNPDNLQDPFNYKLYITKDYKQQLVNIDLIETFNYLFGLHVKKYYKKVYDDIQYVAVLGEKEGKTYVIIWRPTKNINVEKDKENINVEKDKENINDILKNINIDVDEIYVNTDAILDRSFNVIDSLFKNLMLNN
jgi:adenine-specific DNA-methyltransferase